MSTIQSTLTCQFTHLDVRGYCKIIAWDNSIGLIQMSPFKITSAELSSGHLPIEIIKERVNDGGFGCREIISFHAMIDACYEHGARQYMIDEIYFNIKNNQLMQEDELKQFDKFECEV